MDWDCQRETLTLFLNFFITVDLQCSVNFCCTTKWPSYTHTHIHIYIYTHMCVYILFSHNIVHHVPSQVIGYNSLCFIARNKAIKLNCLFTPNAIVCIYQPQTPSPSHSFLLPLKTTNLFSMSHQLVSVL